MGDKGVLMPGGGGVGSEGVEPGPVVGDALAPRRAGGLEEALGAVIAERVREYRRQHGLTVGELAQRSGMSKGMLSKIENAQTSPSLATLGRLSEALSVPVTAFFRGLDEEQDVLHVKAGQGLEIQHRGTQKGHRYQLLGRMRAPHDRLEPVLVTLVERTEVFPLYQHPGTELIHMLEGRMEYSYGNARFTLASGDTLQFSGEVTHGPTALLQLPIRFLSIKATGPGSGDR
jgi:transcriptional regulator with XRE-family HTH domain